MNTKNPKHSQNFITSKKIVCKILDDININSTDDIIEIGPGKAHFTVEIAKRSNYIIAVEIDEKLFDKTKIFVSKFTNVKVINTDFLKYSIPNNMTKIFGNIPYNISTEIVKKIALETKIPESYLIVEEGFAKRLLDRKRALALLLLPEVEIRSLTKISKNHFHPQPKVDATLIRLSRKKRVMSNKDTKLYQNFVYKWVNKEYNLIFTKNQFNKAIKHAKVTDINQITEDQFLSLFNSYKLFL